MRRYTRDHEWVELNEGTAVIGISAHAQEQLGDITFVELPEVGRTVGRGDALAVVESVKAASDVYAPVAGEVVEVNGALDEDPELVNREAESGGWFVKLKVGEAEAGTDLMDPEAYAAFLKDAG